MNRSPIERSISYLLLALILIFSITSTGNVAEFVHRYHKGWTGITLGLAFGVTTFVCAYIAATDKSKATRLTSILIGSVFGLASASFQRRIYIDGSADPYTATLLAFLPIMFGEIGLAVLEHLFSHSMQRSDAQPSIAQSDPDRAHTAQTVTEQPSAAHVNPARMEAAPANAEHTPATPTNTVQISDEREERMIKLIDIFRAQPAASARSVAAQIGVSPTTILNDLRTLETQKRIHRNGVVTILE